MRPLFAGLAPAARGVVRSCLMPDVPLVDVASADAWNVESVRVTVFRKNPPPGSVAAQWEAVAGAPPETVTSSPREGADGAEGPFASGRLVIGNQRLDRNDIFYYAHPDDIASGGPLLGACTTVLNDFIPAAKAWLAGLGVIVSRLAFGLVLRQRAQSKEEAYRLLGRYLHFLHLDPSGSSNLSYQINRTRGSRHGNWYINRLSKWGSVRLGATTLSHGDDSGPVASGSAYLGSFARVELDINTQPDRVLDLEREAAVAELDEEMELAVEILRRGDVP